MIKTAFYGISYGTDKSRILRNYGMDVVGQNILCETVLVVLIHLLIIGALSCCLCGVLNSPHENATICIAIIVYMRL